MKNRRRNKGQSSRKSDMQTDETHLEVKLVVETPPLHGIKMESCGNNKIVSDLYAILTDQQIDMFRRTCFGKYLDLPFHKLQGQVLRCLLEVEVQQPNPYEFWAFVCGNVLKFTLYEFAIVTGLKCTGNEQEFDYSNAPPCELLTRYFPDSYNNVKKAELVSCFKERRWGVGNNEDAIKIATLYFIYTFLYSQLPASSIPARDFHLVEDDSYSVFPWGIRAFKDFVTSFSKSMDAEKICYRLNGMPYAIQVWFYECCSRVEPEIAIRKANTNPRLLNWEIKNQKPNIKKLKDGMFSKYCYGNISLMLSEGDDLDLPAGVNPIPFEAEGTDDAPEEGCHVDAGFEEFSTPPTPGFLKRMRQATVHFDDTPTNKRKTHTGVGADIGKGKQPESSYIRDESVPEVQHHSREYSYQSPKDQHQDAANTVDMESIKSFVKTYVDGKFQEIENLIINKSNEIMEAMKRSHRNESRDDDSNGDGDSNDDRGDVFKDKPEDVTDNLPPQSFGQSGATIEKCSDEVEACGEVKDTNKGDAIHQSETTVKASNYNDGNSSPLELAIVVHPLHQHHRDQISDSQIIIPDSHLPSRIPVAKIRFPEEIKSPFTVQPSRIRQPSRVLKSPFVTEFDSGSKGKKIESTSTNVAVKYPFEGFSISGPNHPLQIFADFSKWVHDGLLKAHHKKKYKEERYRNKQSRLEHNYDFVVASSKDKN